MTNDLDMSHLKLIGSVVFQPEFNDFEAIDATQAWSLVLTAGREDKTLGFNPNVGRFFTQLLFAVAASGIVGVLLMQTHLLGAKH